MSEHTWYKEENGNYTLERIDGEWRSHYNITLEDKEKGISYCLENYEGEKN